MRSAAIGDVVEISYQVRLAGQAQGQGQVVDGAASLAAEGRQLLRLLTSDSLLSSPYLPCPISSYRGHQQPPAVPIFFLLYSIPCVYRSPLMCHTLISIPPTALLCTESDPGSRPSDENMYFILAPYSSGSGAAQGAGFGGTALPAGWDASIRGMCVGERRVITLPASLAFGKDGLVLKKTAGPAPASGTKASTIPPNSPIVIDVRLLSLNGVA